MHTEVHLENQNQDSELQDESSEVQNQNQLTSHFRQLL